MHRICEGNCVSHEQENLSDVCVKVETKMLYNLEDST